MRKSRTMLAVFCVFLMLCCLPGCRKTSASESASVDGSATAESAGGTRDNTPQVLNPEAPDRDRSLQYNGRICGRQILRFCFQN